MKKIYFSVLSIILALFIFPCYVKAYDGLSEIQNIASEWGFAPTDQFYEAVNDYWSVNTSYNALCYVQSNNQFVVIVANNWTKNPNITYQWDSTAPSKYVSFNPSNNSVYNEAPFGQNYYWDLQYPMNNNKLVEFSDYQSANVVIDYDNPIYSSSIPVPEMIVTYVGIGLNLPTNINGVYVDCMVEENNAFYIQLQAKYECADIVNVLLNNGVISYEYLDWTNGELFDIYSLQDNVSSVHVTAQEFQDTWDSVIDGLAEINNFPQFTTNVPFWVSNPDASKYVDAKNRYKNVLMRQAPMYGSRMELFARYYAVVDSNVYVGRWVHWNSINPSNTEELSNKYQVDQPFPGYQNTSTNVDLPDNEDTYTNVGDPTSVNQNPYTQVIINSNVPNYPDYPTAVSYNHDNILVQFITTAKQLPSFFGDVGTFLTSSFTFIPSEIWLLIGFGFMCSIVVMIIKVL